MRRASFVIAFFAFITALAVFFHVTSLVGMLVVLAVVGMALMYWPVPFFLLSLLTAPMIGWMMSFTLERSELSERLFAGSLDLPVADVFAVLALMSWGWLFLRDGRWKRWFNAVPLKLPYAALVLAHGLSAFSPWRPDRLAVWKFALRPVAFAYAAYVALPVLAIRTVKVLRWALWTVVATGSVLVIDGLRAFVMVGGVDPTTRAQPMPWFGVYPFGTNHNVLAEWLLVVAPSALALSELEHHVSLKKYLRWFAVVAFVVALLTFSRTAWIVAFFEIGILLSILFKKQLQTYQRHWPWLVIAFIPFTIVMLVFTLGTQGQGSTEARATLLGIALQLFTSSPILGVGAGTFVSHVDQTLVYHLLFGGPMDAHGVIQKLLAETGALGCMAFAWVWGVIGSLILRARRTISLHTRAGRALMYLSVSVLGAFIYQLFNTTYWTAKLWLPVGILFAAWNVFYRDSYET